VGDVIHHVALVVLLIESGLARSGRSGQVNAWLLIVKYLLCRLFIFINHNRNNLRQHESCATSSCICALELSSRTSHEHAIMQF
jgi:hypothetical protein